VKSEFASKIFVHASIRIVLASAIISALIIGMGLLIADVGLRVVISIPFVAAVCFYTAMTIARHSKDLMAAQFDMLHESAEMLKIASMSLADVAKGVYLNTHIMKGAAGTILKNADTLNEADNYEKHSELGEK